MSEPNKLLDSTVNSQDLEDRTSSSQDNTKKAFSMTLEELRNKGFIRILADLFDSSNRAKALLERVKFPRALMVFPDHLTPLEFFETSCREIERGVVEGLTFEVLLAEAAKLYPGNLNLQSWRAHNSNNIDSSSGIGLVISGDIGDAIALFDKICELSQQLELAGKINLVLSTENTLSLNLTDANAEQALTLQSLINTSLGDQQDLEVRIIGSQFIDHFIRRTYIEGPDGGRFALVNVPASTTISEVVNSTLSQYHNQGEMWPVNSEGNPRSADIRRQRPDGSTERISPDQTLGGLGVGEDEKFEAGVESTAAIGDRIRLEAYARVRAQILDFTKSQQNFQVYANDPELPTEYTIHFQIPSWAPPLDANQPPQKIDLHKVIIRLPPNFPIEAPIAQWKTKIFHPNIDERTGIVCLGELRDRYQPALNFGKLCQLLMDIASYQNYNVDDPLNLRAAEWAKTEAGQRAILRCGGKSIEQKTQNKVSLDSGKSKSKLRIEVI
jgi:hypothetical protein